MVPSLPLKTPRRRDLARESTYRLPLPADRGGDSGDAGVTWILRIVEAKVCG